MVKKQLFYLFYTFCSFTLLVCGEKNILQNLTNSPEPEPDFFWPLGSEPFEKKIAGAGAAWEKNQEPQALEKSQEPEPVPEPEQLKILQAPMP